MARAKSSDKVEWEKLSLPRFKNGGPRGRPENNKINDARMAAMLNNVAGGSCDAETGDDDIVREYDVEECTATQRIYLACSQEYEEESALYAAACNFIYYILVNAAPLLAEMERTVVTYRYGRGSTSSLYGAACRSFYKSTPQSYTQFLNTIISMSLEDQRIIDGLLSEAKKWLSTNSGVRRLSRNRRYGYVYATYLQNRPTDTPLSRYYRHESQRLADFFWAVMKGQTTARTDCVSPFSLRASLLDSGREIELTHRNAVFVSSYLEDYVYSNASAGTIYYQKLVFVNHAECDLPHVGFLLNDD